MLAGQLIPTCIRCFLLCLSGRVMEGGQQEESENRDPSCALIQAGTLNQYQAAERGMLRTARVKVTNIKPVWSAKLNVGIPEGLWVLTYLNEEEQKESILFLPCGSIRIYFCFSKNKLLKKFQTFTLYSQHGSIWFVSEVTFDGKEQT